MRRGGGGEGPKGHVSTKIVGEEHSKAKGDIDEEHLATLTVAAISPNPPRSEPHSEYPNNFVRLISRH